MRIGESETIWPLPVTDTATADSNQTDTNPNNNSESASTRIQDSPSRFVAFTSSATNLVPGDTNGGVDVFVRDRRTGTTELVSVASDETQANNFNFEPSISADGRFVAFTSFASNLVPGDTNSRADVFVRDRQTGTTERVSVTDDEAQAGGGSFDPSISATAR